MRLAWGAKVSPEFVRGVLGICQRIGIADPSWLMACMAFETGRTFSPSIRNEASGATGLIQFMPSTAERMGTSVAELAAMSAEAQLRHVEAYFRPYAGKLNSLDDVYMAILWPKAIGSLLHSPLFSRDDTTSRAYAMNKGLDLNQDGVVTKGEATAKVERLWNEGLQPGNVLDMGSAAAQIDAGEAVRPQPTPDTTQPQSTAPEPVPGVQTTPEENPMLAALLPMILSVFAPRVSAAYSKATGQAPETLQPLLTDLFAAVGRATGTGPVTNDADAVKAVAALQQAQPEVVRQVESEALDILDKYAPMFEKARQWEVEDRVADEASMNAAQDRYVGAAYDPAILLTRFSIYMVGAVTGALAVWITVCVIQDKPVGTEMWAALTGMIGWLQGKTSTIYDHRFGTSRGSSVKDAVIQQLSRGGK